MTTPRRQTDPPRPPWAPDPARRRLTEREREVALLVADGLKDVVIARRLGLSRSTVGTHIHDAHPQVKLDRHGKRVKPAAKVGNGTGND